jgi:phage-related protein
MGGVVIEISMRRWIPRSCLAGMYLIRCVAGEGAVFGCDQEASGWVLLQRDRLRALREWLKKLDQADRRFLGEDIATAEYGWPVGMPVCRPLGKDLYEIRSDISHRRIARVIFCVVEGKMVLLHGFVKKTQKTPKGNLDLALKRKKEVRS